MTDELVTLATRARTHAVSELFRVLHKLDTGGFMIRAEGVRQAGDLAELVARLEAIVTPPAYDPDQDETPNQGRGEDLDRTEGDDAPELAADAGTQSEPACGVDGPVGQDHGGAAGEPEPTTEGAGASDPPHAALDFIVGAKHDRRADGSTRIGFEDHRNFPVGKWTRLYVPTARIDECIAALDAIGSGAGTLDEGGGLMSEETRSPAVSPNEAAAILGVSRQTVHALINRGELRRFKVGRLTRIPRGDVLALVGGAL